MKNHMKMNFMLSLLNLVFVWFSPQPLLRKRGNRTLALLSRMERIMEMTGLVPIRVTTDKVLR